MLRTDETCIKLNVLVQVRVFYTLLTVAVDQTKYGLKLL